MKTVSKRFQIEKEMGWENPGPGIRRQIMGYDGQLMMVKVDFEKGAVGTIHEHYQPYDIPSKSFDFHYIIKYLRSLHVRG